VPMPLCAYMNHISMKYAFDNQVIIIIITTTTTTTTTNPPKTYTTKPCLELNSGSP